MITTPTFGSCIQSGIARCSLSPHLCTSHETYKPARATTGCTLPSHLATGRCTADKDAFRCAVTRDACYFPFGFDSTGGTGTKTLPPGGESLSDCNLQHGEGDDGYAIFPRCQDDVDDTSRCVLFKEECSSPTQRLQSATEAYDWTWIDSCMCHDIPVGVCHPPDLAMEDITMETSYCAVGSWDCRDDYTSFISGAEAMKSLPNMKCRLCHNTELKSGACVNPETDNIQKCVLERSACSDETTIFRSSPQLEGSGSSKNTAEATCPSALQVKIGACTSPDDEVDCVAHKDACYYGYLFEERDNCNLLGNVRHHIMM